MMSSMSVNKGSYPDDIHLITFFFVWRISWPPILFSYLAKIGKYMIQAMTINLDFSLINDA